MEILIEVLSFHSRVHVRPDEGYRAPWNPSSLIGNLDGDVLLALNNDNLDGGEVVFTVRTVSFDDGSQRVFEQLEADMGQMSRNVAKVEIFRTDKLNRGTFEHPKQSKFGQER